MKIYHGVGSGNIVNSTGNLNFHINANQKFTFNRTVDIDEGLDVWSFVDVGNNIHLGNAGIITATNLKVTVTL